MKTKQFSPLAVAILFFLFLNMKVSSQEILDVKNLTGTWTFNTGPSFARMSPDIKSQMDKTSELKAEIFSAYEGRTASFLENGDYVQAMANGKVVYGKWTVNNNVLTITSSEGANFDHPILELKKNRLVIGVMTSGEARPYLPELYYTKN